MFGITAKRRTNPAIDLPQNGPKPRPPTEIEPRQKIRGNSGPLPARASAPGPDLGKTVRDRRLALRLTLQQVADRVGVAKSYLWVIEHGTRGNPPSDDVLRRLEEVLGLQGQLIAAARWQETPGEVRREVSALKEKERAGARLAAILRGQGAARSLDDAYRSGELARLIGRLDPEGEGQGERGRGAKGPATASKRGGKGAEGDTGNEPRRRGRAADAASAPLLRVPRSKFKGDVLLNREVPLINKVAAGYPREFTDLGYPVNVADEYVRCPDLDDADAFACRVVGDSMLPEYREGDIVVFSPARQITSGMDCFARIEPDHESTFKRAYFEKAGDGAELIRLQPINPAYPARTLPREQIAGLYAAVSVMRRIA